MPRNELNLKPVNRAEHGLDCSEFDVRVHSCAPLGSAVGDLDLDEGKRARFGAAAERLLAVTRNLEIGRSCTDEGVDECSDSPIATPFVWMPLRRDWNKLCGGFAHHFLLGWREVIAKNCGFAHQRY